MRISVVASALVAVLVGFGSTLALVVAAAKAVGASEAQTATWVSALCLSMAVTSTYLSIRHRMPIITAWSTPGAALIAASSGVGLDAATGAFLVAGVLVMATALIGPLGRLVERIPAPIAAAMLAGVLLQFATGMFQTAKVAPEYVWPLFAVFLIARLVNPSLAVLAALVAGVALTVALGAAPPRPEGLALELPTAITPAFPPSVVVGLALPLYLVTMASQNLPGFAVLRAAGYTPPTRSILAVTGLASVLTAPFGAHQSNLAAITAAICMGPEAHPDPARRWLTGPFYGLFYLLLAAAGAAVVPFFAALPPALIVTIAGLGLLGPLMSALAAAFAEPKGRMAAVVALTLTASGYALLGVGAAFWGLLAGLLVAAGEHVAERRAAANRAA